MATQVWLLRHGEAVPQDSRPDAERELTPRGERQARAAGRALNRLGLEFDACYSSPRVRARETARLACDELGLAVEEAASLSGGFDAGDLRELLHAHDDGAAVLLVGHEPDFSQLAADLAGARVDVKKGGVVALRTEGRRGALLAVLRPRELDAIAG